MNFPADINELVLAIQKCRRFIGQRQIEAMGEAMRGEEREFFRSMFLSLAQQFDTMPKTYEQDGKGEQAIVYLHYFKGGGDWYITEKDMETPEEPGQHQAFGLACPFGDGGELGYISILELIRHGVELDLYWAPRTLGEVRGERGGA